MPPAGSTHKTAYVVLGMHRSGTSAVAGSLAELGARPPSLLMPAKADNPLGFWESERIVAFSDEVLAAAGSHWQDWGPVNPDVFRGRFADHFVSASQWILAVEFGDAETIVLKDPRICRFYPFWRNTLKAKGFVPVVIIPVRDPDQVAQSLFRRNGLPLALGWRLWLRHVFDAELSSRSDIRHVATLGALITQRRERFGQLMMHSGRNPAATNPLVFEKIDRFWDRGLNSEPLSPRPVLPDLVQRTWSAFQILSEEGDSVQSLCALDRLREEFENLCLLFYDPPELQ